MSQPREVSENTILGYSVLAGAARAVLPPVIDLALLRTLRGAMFDRMARAMGVTLTVEARRILVDLEEPGTRRGAVDQSLRWIAGRVFPIAGTLDAVRNALRTHGAGTLFRRYLSEHRPEPRDPVLNEAEAERLRYAINKALALVSFEQLQQLAGAAGEPVRTANQSHETSIVQRYGDAFVATVAELPAAWAEATDRTFVAALQSRALK